MSKQSALPLSWPDRYTFDNFIVAECNKQAFDLVCHPESWKANVLLIQGPDFSGKTHLTHIFQNLHSGEGFEVLDSIDRLIAEQPDQTEGLFHQVNAAMLGQGKILLTMRETPPTWAKLPDLLSRLQASQLVKLEQPDESMIQAAYKKLFIDRGLIVDNKVLDYLAIRSQRSFADIQSNVAKLDTLSLESGRKITIPLIQEAGIV